MRTWKTLEEWALEEGSVKSWPCPRAARMARASHSGDLPSEGSCLWTHTSPLGVSMKAPATLLSRAPWSVRGPEGKPPAGRTQNPAFQPVQARRWATPHSTWRGLGTLMLGAAWALWAFLSSANALLNLHLKTCTQDLPWLRCRTPSAGGLGSIHGQGARSHVPQLK